MIRAKMSIALMSTLALSALATIGLNTVAFADDTAPANSTPPAEGANGRHHNPEWAACKKQADDQKLAPGDARREFMKNCLKSVKSAPTSS
jgi:psiF repeat-containing protein